MRRGQGGMNPAPTPIPAGIPGDRGEERLPGCLGRDELGQHRVWDTLRAAAVPGGDRGNEWIKTSLNPTCTLGL